MKKVFFSGYKLVVAVTIALSALLTVSVWYYKTEPQKTYFLILSGGRTGSTWLVSMLNELTHTELQEVMWKPFAANQELQIAIDYGDVNLKKKLTEKNKSQNLAVLGSKLIFSNVLYPDSIFLEIGQYLKNNKDFKPIFLYRDYYETFLSWHSRGVYHDSVHPKLPQRGMLPPIPRKIFLLNVPGEENSVTHKAYQDYPSPAKFMVSYTDAINKMLVCFCVDVGIVTECLNTIGRPCFIVNYQDISEKFKDIVKFCGIKATEQEIQSTLDKPITRKLNNLDGYVFPKAPLYHIAELLNKKLQDVLAHKKTMQDLFVFDEKGRLLIIQDAELQAVFGRFVPLAPVIYGLGKGFLIPAEGRP